ncbi:hypothetical protein WMY93_000715 [Mugilogobius chulae]|uniref:Uncharacterized protein n=1 Tax=Mugilogobius chulae TaxID=88201 RepID=A0AAW0Q375_9GOBI
MRREKRHRKGIITNAAVRSQKVIQRRTIKKKKEAAILKEATRLRKEVGGAIEITKRRERKGKKVGVTTERVGGATEITKEKVGGATKTVIDDENTEDRAQSGALRDDGLYI